MVVYGGAGGRRARWSGGAPHASLAMAAAEGREGDRGRGDVARPGRGSGLLLGILPHVSLAVAAAEGGEGDERGDVPGPIGSLQRLGILFPSSHLHFVIWPSYFSSFFTRRSSHFFI